MDTLKSIVNQVVAGYAGEGLNGVSYLTRSDDGNVLTVTDFARIKGKHVTGVSVVVRLVGDLIIIERDQNDKLVLDALTQAGIPRSQIILAYAGEPLPESA
jgi:hypothetical protein